MPNGAQLKQGILAQLVEQWTENPCVPGSIPGDTTKKPITVKSMGFLFTPPKYDQT